MHLVILLISIRMLIVSFLLNNNNMLLISMYNYAQKFIFQHQETYGMYQETVLGFKFHCFLYIGF